jgi:Protein of unknown function (DUF4238)
MPSNKKHHFVPRFYLRRFSADGTSINLYHILSSRRILGANLKNQAYRDYFYGKELEVERAIADLEAEAATVLRTIDKYQSLPPPFSPDHVSLVTHLVMQQARTEHEAEALNEINNAMMQRLMGPVMAAKGVDLSQFKVNLTQPGAFSVAIASRISPLALDLHYKLLIDQTGQGFVTSDNPVVACNPLLCFRNFGSNCGIAAKGLQLYFPIDPQKLIMFFDGAAYRVGSNESVVVNITKPADIHEINTLQMVSASANVYFSDEQLNLAALHRKAGPYFRTRKARFTVLKEKDLPSEKSEIFASSREDVRTDLLLTFMSIRKAMKKWREVARRQRTQPAAEVRNPPLVESFREFEKEVRAGRSQPMDFLEGVVEAYSRRYQSDSESGGYGERRKKE